MSNDLEQFNAHQQDVSNRGTALVKAILLISGGALSISIGVFARRNGPELTDFSISALQWSWFSLFGAVLLLITSLVVIIARDYSFGERWRDCRHGKRANLRERIVWVEVLIWATAVTGYLFFVLGMLGLASVASAVVGHA
jgi:hypothetical protein